MLIEIAIFALSVAGIVGLVALGVKLEQRRLSKLTEQERVDDWIDHQW